MTISSGLSRPSGRTRHCGRQRLWRIGGIIFLIFSASSRGSYSFSSATLLPSSRRASSLSGADSGGRVQRRKEWRGNLNSLGQLAQRNVFFLAKFSQFFSKGRAVHCVSLLLLRKDVQKGFEEDHRTAEGDDVLAYGTGIPHDELEACRAQHGISSSSSESFSRGFDFGNRARNSVKSVSSISPS